jgi:hypothetical protein
MDHMLNKNHLKKDLNFKLGFKKQFNRSGGFSIISAIFITTVMSLSAYFIVNISIETFAGINIVSQGTRAVYAAKSGVEWGLTSATINNSCPQATTIYLNQDGLAGFSVYITCSSPKSGQYYVTATASYGVLGQFGYVTRTAAGNK